MRRVYESSLKHLEQRQEYPKEGEREFLDILKLVIENDWTINEQDLKEIIGIIKNSVEEFDENESKII